MSAFAAHGLPLPLEATAADLAKALGLEFSWIQRSVLRHHRHLLEDDRTIDRCEANMVLDLFCLTPVEATEEEAVPDDLPGLAALAGRQVSDVIHDVYKKHRTFIPTNRPLDEREADMVRSVLAIQESTVSPATHLALESLRQEMNALAERNRKRAKERAELMENFDVPEHGVPLDGRATLGDLASALGVDKDALIGHIREPDEYLSGRSRLTAAVAKRALRQYGLRRVRTFAELSENAETLTSIAEAMGLDLEAIITRLFREKRVLIPTNRRLTDGERAHLSSLYPGVPEPGAYATRIREQIFEEFETLEQLMVWTRSHNLGEISPDFEDFDVPLENSEESIEDTVDSSGKDDETPEELRADARLPIAVSIVAPSYDEAAWDEDDSYREKTGEEQLQDFLAGTGEYGLIPEEIRRDLRWAAEVEAERDRRGLAISFESRFLDDVSRFDEDDCPEEDRYKIVVRYLKDPRVREDPWLMRDLTTNDTYLAELYLRANQPGGILGSCVWTRRLSEPLRTRLAERGFDLLMAHPEKGQRHEAEGVFVALGVEAGKSLIDCDLSANTGRDALAEGVAIGWAGTDDEVLTKLLAYPRARPRRPLTCLMPGLREWTTRLDPRVPPENWEQFRDIVLPMMLLDRDKEIRRRARIAHVLSDLPWGAVVSFSPGFRSLRADAERYQALAQQGRGDDFRFENFPEMPPALQEIKEDLNDCRYAGAEVTERLMDQALDVVLDSAHEPVHRDWIERALLLVRTLGPAELLEIAERGRGDAQLLWEVVSHPKADLAVLRYAVEAAPNDLGILGTAVHSKQAREDAGVRAVLEQATHPHVLLVLARARIPGMPSRAFEALIETDPVRALSLAEDLSDEYRFKLSQSQWSAVLSHTSGRMREKAIWMLGHKKVQIQ